MTSQEFLGDRHRAQEEEYFQKREQELIAKLQQRAHAAAARGELAARTGLADQEILDDLAALGYTRRRSCCSTWCRSSRRPGPTGAWRSASRS